MSSFESIKPLYLAQEDVQPHNFIEAARLNFERSLEKGVEKQAKKAKRTKKVDWIAFIQDTVTKLEEA